ncbi:MAG: PQQ-dependent sugar dehydrogenase [Sphingobium sp.]|nr:PQQ-dependent sugar dehydrogenase [Sphingobium sp.]
MQRLILSTFLLASLSACGGSSTPTPTPTPSNSPPVFTSPATASVAENQTLVYQATASDPNGDAVAYSIAGGPDAAQFTLDGNGKLSFTAAPNFDAPQDSNGDNVYEVTLRASDGNTNTTLNLQVTVTNSKEGIAVHRVATGFSQSVQVYAVPGQNDQIYVGEKGGRIYLLDLPTGAKTLILTADNISTDGERGLIGFAAGVVTPGTVQPTQGFFVLVTNSAGDVELRVYARNPSGLYFLSNVDPYLLRVPHSANNNHNGGWVDFGPDGQLYVGIGDGGGSGDPNNNAQNPSSQLGKILRLAPVADPYAGASPRFWGASPNNPYASGGGDPYVFALGLRNPFRAAFEGNNLIIGDVGQNAVEEVDIIPVGTPGANLGWHFLEGTHSFTGTAPAGLTAPKLQYTHGNGPFQGASVIGGRVYHGTIAAIDGHYFFGDYVSQHVWSLPYSRLLSGPLLDGTGFELRDADLAPDAGTINMPVSFNVDRAGRLYIVDLDGDIFRVDAG